MNHAVDSLVACHAGNEQPVRTTGKTSQASLQLQPKLDLVTVVHQTGPDAVGLSVACHAGSERNGLSGATGEY